jgi:hypothetical protein
MTLRTATTFLMGAAFGLLLALGLASLAQDRLARVEDGYRAGTYLAHRPDYAALYRNSQARALDCDLVRAEGTADLAVCRWSVDDRAGRATLVIDYDAEGHAVDDAEYPAPARTRYGMAEAAAAIDIGSTLVAVSQLGAGVEANLLPGALLRSPLGTAAWIGAWAATVSHSDGLQFADCVEWRSGVGQYTGGVIGGATGGLLGPVGYLIGLGIGLSVAADPSTGDAVARCLEVR